MHMNVLGTYLMCVHNFLFLQGLGPDVDNIMPTLEDRIFCLKTRDTAVRTVVPLTQAHWHKHIVYNTRTMYV